MDKNMYIVVQLYEKHKPILRGVFSRRAFNDYLIEINMAHPNGYKWTEDDFRLTEVKIYGYEK